MIEKHWYYEIKGGCVQPPASLAVLPADLAAV